MCSDPKTSNGEVLINAQHGPVGINRHGKPVAVVISASEYAQLEALKAERGLESKIDYTTQERGASQANNYLDGRETRATPC